MWLNFMLYVAKKPKKVFGGEIASCVQREQNEDSEYQIISAGLNWTQNIIVFFPRVKLLKTP